MARATTGKKAAAAKRFGKLSPLYKFYLNPYTDVRFTVCLKCGGKTKQRKMPLVIHVDPRNLISLNMTCRYCPYCDLLIVHKDELESLLASYFSTVDPEVIGNDYLVIGTMERAAWQRGTRTPQSVQDTIDSIHDFKQVLHLKITGGWQRAPGSAEDKGDPGDRG